MANESVLVTETYLEDIANAIRAKNETKNTYLPGQMAAAIMEIETMGAAVTDTTLVLTGRGISTSGSTVNIGGGA